MSPFEDLEESKFSGKPVECFRFTHGSRLWLFTSSDREIQIPAGVFAPEVIRRGGSSQTDEDASGNLDIFVKRDNPVASLFVGFPPESSVSLIIYRVHRGEETDQKAIWTGSVVSARFVGSEATLVGSPLSAGLKRRIPGLTYQNPCNHYVYSTGCGANPLLHRDPVTVTTVTGAQVVSNDFALRADGWYAGGKLEIAGRATRLIVAHVGNTVTLMSPMPGLQSLDTGYAYKGCDRHLTTCRDGFSNLDNHYGFDAIPSRNPHDQRYA